MQIPLLIDPDEIRAYLDFSRDPNPIHRDTGAARRAALALLCAGKQADPSTIDRIAWDPWESIIVPGTYASLKSVSAFLALRNISREYAVSELSINFSAPMITPVDRPLETCLNIEPREIRRDKIGFDLTINGRSFLGQDIEYQRITAEFARTDSPLWAAREAEPITVPDQKSAFIWGNMIYNYPAWSNWVEDPPFLTMIKANDGSAAGLCYLLSLIPASLMNAPGRLKGNLEYQSMFNDPHRKVAEEINKRKEAWARYDGSFGLRPRNSEGEVHAYLSQTLRFHSPANIEPNHVFSAVVSLHPDGVFKNTGRLIFQNHGHWSRVGSETDHPYFTGKSDVIALPAYPRQVIERAVELHGTQKTMGKTGNALP